MRPPIDLVTSATATAATAAVMGGGCCYRLGVGMVTTPQPCWPHLDEPVLSGRWHPSVEPTAVLFGMPAVFVSATINARAPCEVTDFQITLNPDRVWHALWAVRA